MNTLDFFTEKDISYKVRKFSKEGTEYKVLRFEDWLYGPVRDFTNSLTKDGWKLDEKAKAQDSHFHPEDSKVKTVIMFSGGIDSLSLALRHLEKGEPVALLSLIFNPEECLAAKITVDILQQVYGNSMVGVHHLLGPLYSTGKENTYGLTQQPVAAFFSSFMPADLARYAKHVEFAYCMNDDAISYLSELRTLYYTSFSLKRDNEAIPKITFPLMKTKHWENLSYLNSIESKYGVLFPTFSSERVAVQVYYKDMQEIYVIHCDGDTDGKENKKCPYKGYIIEITKQK